MPKRHIRQLHFLFERIKLTKQSKLSHYLKEIKQYSILGKEEEFELARRIRINHDESALERFVCSNMRIVVTIAKRYENRGLPLLDLINAGNEGLIHAAQRYDERKNVRFYWYGQWWIRRAIQVAISTARSILPKSNLAKKIKSQIARFIKKNGYEPTDQELSKILGVEEHKVIAARTELLPTYSLDEIYQHLDRDIPEEQLDFSKEPEHFDIDHDEHLFLPPLDIAHMKKLRKEKLVRALFKLETREREVLMRHFGLGDYKEHTLQDIALIMNITRERVRQIRNRALEKLKVTVFHNKNKRRTRR